MDTDYTEEDEDVVLPNSPLYEHLKETGFEDPYHEGDKICAKPEGNEEIPKRKKPPGFDWNKVQAWVVTIKKSIFCSFKGFLERLFLPELKAVQNIFRKEILQIVMGSGLLIEEDNTFLKAYTSDDFVNTENSSGGKFWLLERTPFPLLLLPLVFLTYGASACLPVEGLDFILLEKLMKLTFHLSAFLLMLHSLKTLVFLYYDVRSKSALKKLRHMCIVLKELSSSFRKCIRIVQEAEMIARGFTLVSVSGLAQRLELSVDLPVLKPNRQYPEFRKSLFSWLKSIFIKHKEATVIVINCLPLSRNFDCYSHYIATLNLEDYGDILNLDTISPENLSKLLEITDNFSLSCLKSILQLTEVQISEYLKVIYLYTHFIFNGKSVQSVIHEFRKLVWLNDALCGLLKYDDDMMLKVKETHKYYHSIEESTHLKGDISSAENGNTSFGCLKVCVHSLSLHLKAALKRVIDMEDILYSEELKSKDLNDPAVEITLKDKISHLMSEAKAELDSSKECLLDSCEKLNSVFPQETKANELEVPTPVKLQEPVCNQPVQIIPNSDPVAEDEVFEAFISGSKSTEENDQSSDWFETEVKQRRETEASSRMMRELRVVLASKAEEHKAREQLALNLKYGKETENENLETDNLAADQEEGDICDKTSENKGSAMQNSNFFSTGDETCENKVSFDDIHRSNTQHAECVVSSSKLQNDSSALQTDIPSSNMSGHKTEGGNFRTAKFSNDSREGNERMEYNFYPAMSRSFASSIASLAAERNKLCGLGSETFIADSDDISDESCD